MTKPARRVRHLLSAATSLAVIAAPCAALANSGGPYLSWQNKTPASNAPAQSEQVNTATGAYPVPSSPYGQVGDPYASRLGWPAKQAPVVSTPVANISPPPQRQFAPAPSAPIRAPQPVAVMPTSHSPTSPIPAPATPERADPGLADDPDLTPEASQIIPQSSPRAALLPASVPAPVPAPVAASKPVIKPLPVIASAPPPARSESPPPPPAIASAMSTDSAYQVPTTSKYAARIAAVRATQLPTAEAPKTDKPEVKSTATAPEPEVSLASQEADHVFIPGEQYKTPADEPRLYSLHRQYGLRPDPITVTPGATGALLTVSPDTVEGGDPNDDDATSDTGSKKTASDKN